MGMFEASIRPREHKRSGAISRRVFLGSKEVHLNVHFRSSSIPLLAFLFRSLLLSVSRKRRYSIRILCLDLESLIHCAPLVLIATMVKAMNTRRDREFT